MGKNRPKIDEDLKRQLKELGDDEQIDVLLHPGRMEGNLKRFLMSGKNEGELDYNILEIANCIAVKSTKKVILEIAARDDVGQVTIQPTLSTN